MIAITSSEQKKRLDLREIQSGSRRAQMSVASHATSRRVVVVAEAGVPNDIATVGVSGSGAEHVIEHVADFRRTNPIGAVAGVDCGRPTRSNGANGESVVVPCAYRRHTPGVDTQTIEDDDRLTDAGGSRDSGQRADGLHVDIRACPSRRKEILSDCAEVLVAVRVSIVCHVRIGTILEGIAVDVATVPVRRIGITITVIVSAIAAEVHLGEIVGARGIENEVVLDRTVGIDGRISVVAVSVVSDVSSRGCTVFEEDARISEAVCVEVFVEGRGDPLVDGSVAVVVRSVTDFGRTTIGGGIGVVAVTGSTHIARGGRASVC